ncbi:hypothetical protein ACIRRA_13215 [Nocardia sp. NPDC101769]|uniref:hypothetical protein n=1 Tax=Nocardia sp. NPDC101769 TaxID=3364333 RepID=UPI0037F9E0C3
MSRNSQWSAQAIIDRIEGERKIADSNRMGAERIRGGYAIRGLWSCYSDPGELTAAQAHTAMQIHLGCGVDTCLVRQRARTALIAAGRMVLDSRATRTRADRRSPLTVLRDALSGWGALLLGGRHALR